MASSEERDFEASNLGTFEFWESTYQRELGVFKDVGDVGEIWFGEDSQERVLTWIENSEDIKPEDSFIDLGCGNGMMLVELAQRGFTNLTGVDYSESGIALAKSIAENNDINNITFEVFDLISDEANTKFTSLGRTYKVCIDKGTYDAISLIPSDEISARSGYLQTLKKLMDQESLFIITSCNWTEAQLMEFFGKDLILHDKIKTPSFMFGGKTGNTVQEIQKRQQNWLKQRNEQKKDSSSGSAKSTTTQSSSHARKHDKHSDREEEKLPATKDKFQSWLETQENKQRLKLKESSGNLYQEADILKVSSSRTPGYASPESDYEQPADYYRRSNHLQLNGGNDAAKSIMSHQDFDEMANKIVARVKGELDVPSKSYRTEERFTSSRHNSDLGYRSKVKNGGQEELISSHYCPECGTLMFAADHVPIILTPCAHSMCQSCCKGRSLCPQCACTILSQTCNIMLLQIIQNHHKPREIPQQRSSGYTADKYKEKAKTKQQYYEEYENLQTRQEVLKIESKEIQGHMTKLANKIDQQKQQIHGIEREEKKVRDKIQGLKEKLVELETHKKGYDREIEEIEIERKRDKNKLNMVQDTLTSIEIEMEKLQILLDKR